MHNYGVCSKFTSVQIYPVSLISKVWIFWEGHKIWKNLPLKIWRHSVMSNFKWKIFSKFVAFSEYPTFITRKTNHNYLFYTARKDWFDKYYYVAVMLPHVSFNLLAIAVNALLVLSVVKCSRCMMLPWLIANMIWWILA